MFFRSEALAFSARLLQSFVCMRHLFYRKGNSALHEASFNESIKVLFTKVGHGSQCMLTWLKKFLSS